MRMFAIMLSCCIGFVSLSHEILWVRLISFHLKGVPEAFSLVLCVYLFAIAVGAALGKRLTAGDHDLIAQSSRMLLYAALTDGLVLLYRSEWSRWALPFFLFIMFGGAMWKSALFPIVHHLGASTSLESQGRSVSTVYFFNILGSTLGPLVTGYVALDRIGLQQGFLLIVVMDLLLFSACSLVLRSPLRTLLAATSGSLIAILFWNSPILLPALIGSKTNHIIENRQGIVHVVAADGLGDTVFGGNVYDGRINTSLVKNANGVHRAYILAALQPAPKRVLVIGLSGGSWTKIISMFPGVERIDAVEINPGYLGLISSYKEVAGILRDPRLHVHIDDGRRWIRRHPDERYDLIVMNTTFHWRDHTTNLLSLQFLTMLRGHMRDKAILEFNATGSMDAFRTAVAVFAHAYLYDNVIIAGQYDVRKNLEEGPKRVKPLIDAENSGSMSHRHEVRHAVERMFAIPFKTFSEIQGISKRPYEIITDQNMITEFKYGRGLF